VVELYQGGPVSTLYGVDLAQPLGVTVGWARGTLHPKHAIEALGYHGIGVELQALRTVTGTNPIPAIAKCTVPTQYKGLGQGKAAKEGPDSILISSTSVSSYQIGQMDECAKFVFLRQSVILCDGVLRHGHVQSR
jgi:hypothetical protein